MHQRPGDHHPLHLAAREQVGLLVPARSEQAELRLEQLVCAPRPLGGRDAVVGGVEHEVRPDRESARSRLLRWGITASVLRARTGSEATSTPATDAEPPVGRTRVVSTPIVVVFPGSVRSIEQAEDLAGARALEAHAVHRVHRSLRVALDHLS